MGHISLVGRMWWRGRGQPKGSDMDWIIHITLCFTVGAEWSIASIESRDIGIFSECFLYSHKNKKYIISHLESHHY